MPSIVPSPAEVLLDYVSPHGENVTHVRGVLLADAIGNLKSWGVYPQYLEALSERDHHWLVSTLATSWVPIETAEAHYATVARVGVTDPQLEDAGRRMAARVAEIYLSGIKGRLGGIEAFAAMIGKNDKMWDRFYQGGACIALRTGAEAFVLEDYGNPLVRYHAFRHAYLAYMKALANLFRERAQVRETEPSRPIEPALATRFSW